MTFEELFLKSAQAYFKEDKWEEYEKVAPRKYTKDFFDSMEKDFGGDVEDGEELVDGSK